MTYEFIYEFMYMKNIVKSYLNSCVPRFQMAVVRLTTAAKGKLELLDLRALGMEDLSTVAKRSARRRPTEAV